MPNQLILPPQKFRFRDIADQFPKTGNPKKKVFFQAELRAIAGGNATFGVVAYPAWRDKNNWVIGTKVSGTDTGEPAQNLPFSQPVAFANNELALSITVAKKNKKAKKKGKKKARKGRWNEFSKMVNKLGKKNKDFEGAEMLFTTRISENPHLEYDVALDLDGTTITVSTKPSPPAPPEA